MTTTEKSSALTESLGRLKRVPLRDIWSNEATDFTPWLADSDNIQILSDTLGIELEPEAIEKAVGPFNADIVCKEVGTDSTVLIENQLEQTDHDHLGKLLTYSAGLQAVTIIWLAERFRDEHRAALDWLNEISHQNTRFFGIEIELWSIGKSPPAPKFNAVSMPNDWSRSVGQAKGGNAELSELKILQGEYWDAFFHVLREMNGPVNGHRKARPQHWMNHSVGIGGYRLSTTVNESKKVIRVELYIVGEDAAQNLKLLEQQSDEIESEIGNSLIWGDQSESARDRRISLYLEGVDIWNESDWPRQHRWLAENLNNFHGVFANRLRAL